jgi:hypothetical protein
MATSQPTPSTSSRVITALPFVGISLLAAFFMDIPGLMRVPPPYQDGHIVFEGVSVPLLEKFHLLPFMDELITEVTKGFAPFAFYDQTSWWQALNFMNDVGVIYMISLLESSRPAFKGTPVYL